MEESVKGIKVGEIDYYLTTDTEQENELSVDSENYVILIEGGTFAINTVDDAIHTNSGSVLIYGGTLTIDTSDDGIHADTNLKIGGSANITVKTSYGGPGGRQPMGGGEGGISVASGIQKTQSTSGLSKGNHTVTVGSTAISYYNAYSYSGYVTVYATSSATIN